MRKNCICGHRHLGFTLVELLVVISIIGMLAGLLLPAVNAAREAGRRAVCMNNQGQLALALIDYDGARGNLPPMRGILGSTITLQPTKDKAGTGTATITSWIGFLLPNLEQNQLYQNLSNESSSLVDDMGRIQMKSLICPSSEPPQVNTGSHYVCNGGYQNAIGTDWKTGTETETAKLADAPFLDGLGTSVKCSIDYISSHGGTSNVILLSENEREVSGSSGARWAYWSDTAISPSPTVGNVVYSVNVYANNEDRIAFCFPYNTAVDAAAVAANGRLADYGGDAGKAKWSVKGYNILTVSNTEAAYITPSFINRDRGLEYSGYSQYRRARPSSNHPGMILAAFADRSVRLINDNIDEQTFIWICQPNSGQVAGDF